MNLYRLAPQLRTGEFCWNKVLPLMATGAFKLGTRRHTGVLLDAVVGLNCQH